MFLQSFPVVRGGQINQINHECDILKLSSAGYATEIEIKISKADLLKDKEKKHFHQSFIITELYFAVPKELEEIALKEIPERAGLYIIERIYDKYWDEYCNSVTKIKKTERKKPGIKWDDEKKLQLARLGCMRILGLKRKLLESK